MSRRPARDRSTDAPRAATPPITWDEAARVAEVHLYDRLDADAERDLDDLTALAAQICGTPIALVSLITEDRQWFKSRFGMSTTDTARDIAFCAHAIAGRDLFEVPDATIDPRFATNPLVTADPHIRFYAGAPLVSTAGNALGALCVIDRTPRVLTDEQRSMLALLGRQVIRRLEHQHIGRELRRADDERTIALAQVRTQAARLATSEQRLSLVLASAQAGTWEWDLASGVLSFDARFADVMGVAPSGPLPAAEVFRHVGEVELEALHGALAQLVEGRTELLTHDIELAADLSETRWARIRGQVIAAGSDEQPQRAAGLAEDITLERRRDEAQRHAQRLDSIGALAAGVAHEMNTPLQFVSHNLDFLASHAGTVADVVDRLLNVRDAVAAGTDAAALVGECASAAEHADLAFIRDEFAAAIVESIEGIDRVTHIVRALKEFAHPGGTGRELVSMNRMIENAITLTRNEWKFVADFEKDLDPALPPVPWAAHECGQLLVNLIVNAAHAVQAAVAPGQKGRISAQTRYRDGRVEIRLSDTGTGIPVEIRDRIFEPFFTTKPVGGGTGQGLATAHAIVVRHGGTLAVESELGHGTTFVVKLPPSISQRVA